MIRFTSAMLNIVYLTACCLIIQIIHCDIQPKFPDDFVFGASTASYQIEGGWNADGKGENIWDHAIHTNPEYIKDGTTGDIACDSYHNYERDVEMLRELNVDVYRMSISWTRIIPTGFPNQINQAGIDFYNRYIDELLKYNIEPVVTLYHWDLPQSLQDLGGWANPLIVDWFVDFAKIAFQNFGDRVKIWATINEPLQICGFGYGMGWFAPNLKHSGIADYMCYRNILLAHATAYHLYKDHFKAAQAGNVGIAIDIENFEAESDTEENILAEKMVKALEFEITVNPIFSENGDYPDIVRNVVSEKSKEQGFLRSRLIPLTEDEIKLIRGSADFLGINHYSTNIVYRNESTINIGDDPTKYDDRDYSSYKNPNVTFDAMSLYKVLSYVRKQYNNPVVYITENGWANTGGLQDDDRILYFRAQLNGVLNALADGSNIKGYFAWSLMDNFEWQSGLSVKYGLYEVDYDDEKRTRTPKKSAFVYKEIVKSHKIDVHYEPESFQMWIEEGH